MTSKLISIAGKVILSLLLAVIVGALAVLTVIPRAVNGAALTVLSGSMTPEIAVGSVVVVRPVDPATLHVGDVVTYQRKSGIKEYTTHRIIDIHTDTDPITLTTKGDANANPDASSVSVEAVQGKVLFSVPHLGTVRNAIGIRGAGLLLLVLGLAGYALSQVITVLSERRGARKSASEQVAVTAVPPLSGDRCRQQLLVVTLPHSALDGFTAALRPELPRIDVLESGSKTFTVAAAGEPERLDALVELLVPFAPVCLLRSEVLSVPCVQQSPVLAGAGTALPSRAGGNHAAA